MPNKIIKTKRYYEIIKDKDKVKNTIEKKKKHIKNQIEKSEHQKYI